MRSSCCPKPIVLNCALLLCGSVARESQADTLVIAPVADNTIFQNRSSPSDLLSSGAGAGIYSGRTNYHADILHRGLVRFDLIAIPCGATIHSVSLTMTMDRAPGSPVTSVALHRVLADWGEGTSGSFGGSGEVSQAEDANWFERRHPGILWSNPGGDFSPSASASAPVPSSAGIVMWSSNASLVADVSAWVGSPGTNFGWLLLNSETDHGTVRRFVSREGPRESRPNLRVEFSLPVHLEILSPPRSAVVCPDGTADFSILASGSGHLSFQWEIESPDGQWVPLHVTPTPFDCVGVGTGSASAIPGNAAVVTIGIAPCPAVNQYPIRCIVSSMCGSMASSAAMLTICPANFNCDTEVNFFDYLDFVDVFAANLSQADFNHDGGVDFFDYLDFVDAFSSGC